MTQLVTTLKQQLTPYQTSHNKIVLGLSGGLDSRVLLQLLSQLTKETLGHSTTTWQVLAVHVHHGLSANADDWAQLCQTWCGQHAIDFVCERVTLQLGSRVSVEQQARDARYQALAKYMDNKSLLLTGHHADDQLETFLLALKRGSGPKGLSAMASAMPFHSGVLVRPLLNCDRSELATYATTEQLEWIEDESNTDTRFDRNYLRHKIVPPLKERWPQITRQVSKSAQLCAEQQQLLTELLKPIYDQCESNGRLLIKPLTQQSELAQKQLVRMWFSQCQRLMPSQKVLNQILTQVVTAQADACPIIELDSGQLRRYQDALHIVDALPALEQWQQALPLEQWTELPFDQGWLGVFSQVPSDLEPHHWVGEISSSADLSGLHVSYNSSGLHAKPVGRSGSRKLKKLWQEYSVPPWLRQQYPILQTQQQVIAVAGLFVDQRFCGTGYKVIWKKGH